MPALLSSADRRVCPICGAPAQRLGETYQTHDGTGFRPAPAMLGTIIEEFAGRRTHRDAKQSDTGAEPHGKGWAVPYTHECRADLVDSKRASCGLIRAGQTAQLTGDIPQGCRK